jgi:hypothetical protein
MIELDGKTYKLQEVDIEAPCEGCALSEYCDEISDGMNMIEYMLCEGDEFYDANEDQIYIEVN